MLDFARGRLGGGIGLVCDADEPLESVLIQVVDELRAGAPDRLINTEFSLTEPVFCDRSRIGQLVSNLLGNALTYGAIDEPVRVQAFTEAGVLEISVANGGQPISERVVSEPVSTVLPWQSAWQPARTRSRSAHRFRDRQSAWGGHNLRRLGPDRDEIHFSDADGRSATFVGACGVYDPSRWSCMTPIGGEPCPPFREAIALHFGNTSLNRTTLFNATDLRRSGR